MTDWKSIKQDGKPVIHCMCYVCNIRSGSHCFVAIYDPHCDIFTEYDPHVYFHPALDVTHYVQLPWPPKEK